MTQRERSVFITGCSSGIGRACAVELDRAGFHVFACVRRERDGSHLRAICSEQLEVVLADITRSDDVTRAAAQVSQRLGPAGLDALVGCAGVAGAGPVEVFPESRAREIFDVNYWGTLKVIRSFLPLLRAGGGRIVTVGSIQDQFAPPFLSAYAATKAAVLSLHRSLRHELRPWSVDVVLLEVGAIATPIWSKGWGEWNDAIASKHMTPVYGAYASAWEDFVKRTAQSAGQPEHVARFVRRVLQRRRPRAQYRVGWDAHLLWLLRCLPARLLESLFARIYRFPRPPRHQRIARRIASSTGEYLPSERSKSMRSRSGY
jgi:NAD(P)-dependent dehydrogenase (short-subunit alcohol dehydrogenase family)